MNTQEIETKYYVCFYFCQIIVDKLRYIGTVSQ